MERLSLEFRKKVTTAVQAAHTRYAGSTAQFAEDLRINASALTRILANDIEDLNFDNMWLSLASKMKLETQTDNWKPAQTKVYTEIKANLEFCKAHAKSMILIDECGIGKSYSARHVLHGMRNGFYVDCSQGKSRIQFIRLIARSIGMDDRGRYVDLKNNLKYYLINILDKPLIVLDDAGYLDYPSFLEVQELWNATENRCAWYMIGDNSLQAKIEKGITNNRVGYRAIFSRFLDEYIHITPAGKENRQAFIKQLATDVAAVNVTDKKTVPPIVKKVMTKASTLRYLKMIVQHTNQQTNAQ